MTKSRQQWAYKLEQLYEDQEPGYVLETIPHLICWLDPKNRQKSHSFELREQGVGGLITHDLTVSWDVQKLAKQDPRFEADILRFREGKTKTLSGEDRAKYAAYGLALVAVSCLLRRRIVEVAYYRAPDFLLDATSGALRGVEVAGRTSKGYAAFAQALDGSPGKPGKRAQIKAQVDVVEAYISLWCSEPQVSVWEQVKP